MANSIEIPLRDTDEVSVVIFLIIFFPCLLPSGKGAKVFRAAEFCTEKKSFNSRANFFVDVLL